MIGQSASETAALAYLAALQIPLTPEGLWRGLPHSEMGLSDTLLTRAFAAQGLDLHVIKDVALRDLTPPCLLRMRDGNLLFVRNSLEAAARFEVLDPETGQMLEIARDALSAHSQGEVLTATPQIDALATRHAGARPKTHWFWRHFGAVRRNVGEVILASGFANLLAVAVSLFALQVYDRVVPNQNEATLWVLASGAILAIFLEFVLRITRARLIDGAGRDIEIAVNRDLFERILTMRLDRRPMPAGALINTMREFASVKEFFAVSAVGVVTDLPFVLIFLGVIFMVSGPLVVVVALGGLVMVAMGLIFQSRIPQMSRDLLGGGTAALRVLTEAAYGAEVLRSHQSEPQFRRIWEEVVVLNAARSSDHRRLSSMQSFGAASVQMITYVAAITGGVYLFFASQMSVGGIIAVSILTSRALAPMAQLSMILARWQNMKAALEALEAIATAPLERADGVQFIRRAKIEGDLRLRDIQMAYPAVELPQLRLGDIHIEPRMRVAVLGENGSGKSLILRLLSGLYQPNSGSYLVDGIEARQIDPDDMRRNIAYLPQEPRLFQGTVRDNLKIGALRISDAQMFEALDFAGLGGMISASTRGLDLVIQDGGEGLSVGQRAAIGLARIYLQDPAVVLLDEPTAALDSRAELAFVSRLKSWLEGRTAIICTHRMAVMDAVEQVLVLSEGRVLAFGPKEETLVQFARRAQANGAAADGAI